MNDKEASYDHSRSLSYKSKSMVPVREKDNNSLRRSKGSSDELKKSDQHHEMYFKLIYDKWRHIEHKPCATYLIS